MAMRPDGTWDRPWDEPRLTNEYAYKTHCPMCGAYPYALCKKVSGDYKGWPTLKFHPERHYGPIMRMYLWLLQNAGILIEIPESS